MTPTPPPEGVGRPARWLRWCARLHVCARCACVATILLAGPFLYLWIAGIPGPIADHILQHLDAHPFVVTANRIGLSPRGALLLHHVLVYPADSFAEPLLRLDELALYPNIAALARGAIEPKRLRIASGTMLFPPWTRPPSARADARLHLNDIRADVFWTKDRIVPIDFEARCYALAVRGTGSLERAAHRPPRAARWADAAVTLIDAIRQNPDLLPTLINALEETRTETTLTLFVEVGGSTTGVTIAARLEGGPLALRDHRLDRIAGRIGWRDGLLHIESLRASGPDGLRLELQSEPGPPAALPRGLTGSFAFDRFTLRGVPFADGHGRFATQNGRLLLYDCFTRVGPSGERGEASAALEWDPAEHTLAGHLDLKLDPNDFAPFLTSNQLRIARRFGFNGEPPHFSGFIHRAVGHETNLYIRGRLSANSFAYRGVPIDSMQTDLIHTGHTVRLDGWHFERPEGATTGSLVIPLRGRDIKVALDSTMHPAAIAAMLGPRIHRDISAWRFDGPVALRARGIVDRDGSDERTDLSLEVDGRHVGRGRWTADAVTFTLRAKHGTYTATNVTGSAYGGTFRSDVRVEPLPAGLEHRYIVHATLSDADFARIAEGYLKPGDAPPAGRVHLTLQITGLVEDAFGPVTRGGGSLTIEDGSIFRMRLFGGLSDLLSRLVPGLGFVSQTDLTCTFRVEEGAIFSDDIQLEGDAISMRANGSIEFDGHARLQVEVQLLRRGPIATLLRLLTMPLTKLFEFRLTGTLDDPQWRPIKLPKELFLIFD